MDKFTIFDWIRHLISGVAFTIFLKCNRLSEEQYLDMIYEQEKDYRTSNTKKYQPID